MTKAQVYRNEYAEVEASHEEKLIQVTWLQHISGNPSREVLAIARQYARTHGLTRWLCDMRRLDYTTVADQLWTVKEHFPSFDHKLLHHIACVVSPQKLDLIPDTFIQQSIKQDPLLAESIKLRVFMDKGIAAYWLLH